MFGSIFKNYKEIPVIKLSGVIGHNSVLRGGLNLNNLNKIIEKAFSFKKNTSRCTAY